MFGSYIALILAIFKIMCRYRLKLRRSRRRTPHIRNIGKLYVPILWSLRMLAMRLWLENFVTEEIKWWSQVTRTVVL